MIETAVSRQSGRAALSETRDHDRPLRIWLPAVRAGSGSDVFVQRLAVGLRRAGHDPIVQWFPHRYELIPWKLAKVRAPEGTELIHAGSWQAFAFKRAGLPLVVTEHHYVEHPSFAPYRSVAQAIYHRLFIRQCLRLSYRRADAVFAVSQHTAQAMTASLGRPVDFIYNWIDTDRYRATPSQILREEGDRKFRLLFVGNPSRWKGSDILPKLAVLLGNDFEIRCLGGLRRDFHSRNTPGNLVALEAMAPDDMPAVYSQVDAVLVPARYEAFGYVALEAMACGLPVVGFDSTGTREICVNGETALLSPVEDLHALSRNCRRLASNPDLVQRLGAAGRRRAVALFSERAALERYLDCYKSLVADLTPKSMSESRLTMRTSKNTKAHWSRGQLELVPICPACGSSERRGQPLACSDYRTPLRDDTWYMHRCAGCSSLYLDPRPDQESLPRAYEVYYTHSQDDEQTRTLGLSGLAGVLWRLIHGYLNQRFALSRQSAFRSGAQLFRLMIPWRMKLDYYGRHLYLSDFPRRGRLLDVGCGNGAFLARAAEMGWQVDGLDPDPAAVAVCADQNLHVVQGALGDAPAEWAGQFDVVTMSHSIEHVTDPGMELKRVYSLLRAGGVLWLACPNPNSLGSRLYGRAWRGLHPPYHLVIPSARQLSRLLLDAGFVHPVPVRRGAHARWMMQESAKNARHAGGVTMHVRALLAPLVGVLADLAASAVPGGAEETVIMARRPAQP